MKNEREIESDFGWRRLAETVCCGTTDSDLVRFTVRKMIFFAYV
jgi:hypothetical protein